MRVIWDPAKSVINERKHGVSFEQAYRLFSSGLDYLELYDAGHSDYEDRYIAVGPVDGRILIVVWSEPEEDVMRIISARYATAQEANLFYTETGRTNE